MGVPPRLPLLGALLLVFAVLWSNQPRAAGAADPAYSVSWLAHSTPSTMSTGATTGVTLSFSNSGSLTWAAGGSNPVHLSYHWKNGGCPGASTAAWDGRRANLAADVAPGGTVSNLALGVEAPTAPGSYCLIYDLVREGLTWFSWQGAATLALSVNVVAPQYGVAWGAHSTPANLGAGSTMPVSVSFTNSGTLTWAAGGANPVHLSYHWRSGDCPGGATVVWDGRRANLAGDVANSVTVSALSLQLLAPSSPGAYCLVYDLVREGVTWFSSQGAATLHVPVNVGTPAYAVAWSGQTAPSTMTAGSAAPVNVSFTNTGSLTWASGGTSPVHLSYHWRNGACPGSTSAVWDGERGALAADVPPGSAITNLPLLLAAPGAAGPYCLVYDLVREGVTWFSWQGAATTSVSVAVVSAATATPTATPAASATPSPTVTPTATPSPTLTPTPTPTSAPTQSPTATRTPSPPGTLSPTSTSSPIASPTLSPTSASGAGPVINPGDSIQAAVNANPPGTTFRLRAGVHRLTTPVTPKDSDVFTGDPGAVLSGARVLAGFTKQGSYWVVGGQTQQGQVQGTCGDATYTGCRYPEAVFIDNVSLWQVTSLSSLGPGKFYFDYAGDKIYIADDPTGSLVEATVASAAFCCQGTGVTIQGLIIEKFSSPAQRGAVEAESRTGWVIQSNEIRYNSGGGIRIGPAMRVLGNNVHHNGQIGVTGIGDDVLVESNQIAFNNTNGFDGGWEAGGTKFVLTNRLIVRTNNVHHNSGPGLWTDIDNINSTIEGNTVTDNEGPGIFHEISYAAVIRNNTVARNGFGFDAWLWGAQIMISNSRDVEVYGNQVTMRSDVGNGIAIVQQNRGSGPYGARLSQNDYVHHNSITYLGNSGITGAAADWQEPQFLASNNRFDYNTYHVASSLWFLWQWDDPKDWSGFRAGGQEAHGSVDNSIP